MDNGTLIEYAETLGNGAVFKRLGSLAGHHTGTSTLAEACRDRMTKGNARLDPCMNCTRLVSHWRLWVPESWLQGNPV